jgi:hypothetical protein
MKIEAFDEFGYILWYYAPISYDAFLKGKLISTKSKIGTKPVFYFSENHTEDEIHYDPPRLKKTLQPIEHFTSCYKIEGPLFIKDNWTPPPYKKIFKNDVYVYDKPILTINNKNTKEWGQHPHNYFNSDFLNKIFTELKSKYQIIYIRPPDKSENFKLQKDTNQISLDIGDKEILAKHPEVIDIETLLLKSDKVYNEVQFMILSNSDYHITPAGDAVVPSYFGGEVLIYNCPNCNSSNRGVWKTGSWMEKLSGSKIYGFNNYDNLLNYVKTNWL